MFAIPYFVDPRARVTRSRFALVALLSLSCAVLVAGCSTRATDTTAPPSAFQMESPFAGDRGSPSSDPSARGGANPGLSHYPLAVGNSWDYVLSSRIETIPTEGEPSAWNGRAPWRAEVVDRTMFDGREYFRIAEGDPRSASPITPQYLQRQDGEGLFEYDNGPIFAPAATPAPGAAPLAVVREALAAHQRSLAGTAHRAAFERAALQVTEKLERMRDLVSAAALATTEPTSHELVLLRYPVRVGASWIVRTSPSFSRVVVGQDEMVLPVGRVRAWRLRGESELFSATDRVYFWYGRAGLVRIHSHAEMDATDDTGNIIGKAIGEFDQSLARVTLGGPVGPTK